MLNVDYGLAMHGDVESLSPAERRTSILGCICIYSKGKENNPGEQFCLSVCAERPLLLGLVHQRISLLLSVLFILSYTMHLTQASLSASEIWSSHFLLDGPSVATARAVVDQLNV
jgi:hypothetical protein